MPTEVEPVSRKVPSAKARYLAIAAFLGLATGLKLLPRLIDRPPPEPPAEEVSELDARLESRNQNLRELDRLARSAPLQHWLSTLESELDRCNQGLLVGAALRPPASDDAIAQLTTLLGCDVPSELAVLLRWHDGQRWDDSIILCEGTDYRLLGVEEIRAAVTRVRAGSPQGKTSMLPFLSGSRGTIMLAIDTSKPRSVCRLHVEDDQPTTELDCYQDSLQELFGRCAYAVTSACDGGSAQ